MIEDSHHYEDSQVVEEEQTTIGHQELTNMPHISSTRLEGGRDDIGETK